MIPAAKEAFVFLSRHKKSTSPVRVDRACAFWRLNDLGATPRVRGKEIVSSTLLRYAGTTPHNAGKDVVRQCRVGKRGNNPAYAGKDQFTYPVLNQPHPSS